MDSLQKELLIAKISWGCLPVTIYDNNSQIVHLILHTPTAKEKSNAALIHELEYRKAIKIGLPTEETLLKDLIQLGMWSVENEERITGIKKDIHTIRKSLLSFLFNVNKLAKAKSLLRRAESVLIDFLGRRYILLQNSAEAHAEICRQRYLIGKITHLENGELFWATEKEFNDCSDNRMIDQLCELFFNRLNISLSLIRELARSSQWRSYWDISKNSNVLFDNSVMSWSSSQKDLAYWSTIYDSVYSSLDRPSKYIIDDDDLLDSWFIHQGEKIDNDTNKNLVKPSDKNNNEEFIMTDEEGAKRVYGLNDVTARAKIKSRQNILKKNGSVRQQDMPDSQMEMRTKLIEKQRQHVKSINNR